MGRRSATHRRRELRRSAASAAAAAPFAAATPAPSSAAAAALLSSIRWERIEGDDDDDGDDDDVGEWERVDDEEPAVVGEKLVKGTAGCIDGRESIGEDKACTVVDLAGEGMGEKLVVKDPAVVGEKFVKGTAGCIDGRESIGEKDKVCTEKLVVKAALTGYIVDPAGVGEGTAGIEKDQGCKLVKKEALPGYIVDPAVVGEFVKGTGIQKDQVCIDGRENIGEKDQDLAAVGMGEKLVVKAGFVDPAVGEFVKGAAGIEKDQGCIDGRKGTAGIGKDQDPAVVSMGEKLVVKAGFADPAVVGEFVKGAAGLEKDQGCIDGRENIGEKEKLVKVKGRGFGMFVKLWGGTPAPRYVYRRTAAQCRLRRRMRMVVRDAMVRLKSRSV